VTEATLPVGYRAAPHSAGDAFACEAAIDWLDAVLDEGPSVYAWAARKQVTVSLAGRGPVYVVTAPVAGPDGRQRWAVRHYRRGGAVGHVVRDWYWGVGRTRPLRELAASLRARDRGVRTPAVVAGVVYRVPGFYRADLVTELVPGARSLVRELFEGAPERGRPPADTATAVRALVRAGRMVRSLEQARLLHSDLNAGNVLLDDAGQAWVIDLDRCRAPTHRDRASGPAMLSRLERSLRKLGTAYGRPLSETEWEALRHGFAERP
jgi:3-deoxy-D-manno-octulosonic acid kinase